MATIPTPEEAAQYILDIFVKNGCRPGYVLSSRNFITDFVKLPWHTSDFVPWDAVRSGAGVGGGSRQGFF